MFAMRFPFGDVLNSSQFDIAIYSRFVVSIYMMLYQPPPCSASRVAACWWRPPRHHLRRVPTRHAGHVRCERPDGMELLGKIHYGYLPMSSIFFRALAYPYDRWLRGWKNPRWSTRPLRHLADQNNSAKRTPFPIKLPSGSRSHSFRLQQSFSDSKQSDCHAVGQ